MEMAFKNDDKVLFENRDMLREGGIFSDCPIGWGTLVRQLFNDIRDACKKHKSTLPLVAQVKSKFGGLCFYLDHQNDQFDENSSAGIEVKRLIKEAEKKSYAICEITGLPGSVHIKDRWFATLNEKKANELGYKKA